jgi:hypothetical protein
MGVCGPLLRELGKTSASYSRAVLHLPLNPGPLLTTLSGSEADGFELLEKRTADINPKDDPRQKTH